MAGDLVSRLLAAIEETERLARAAGIDGAGTHDQSWHTRTCGYGQGELLLDCKCDVPASILRLCQAHRDIVAMHAEVPVAPGRRETTCAECGSVSGWPCPTLVIVSRGYGIEDGEGNDG